MSNQALVFIIKLMGLILAGLYIFLIFIKIANSNKARLLDERMQIIIPALKGLFDSPGGGNSEMLNAYIAETQVKIKSKSYRDTFETVLLNFLEDENQTANPIILLIAYEIGLPQLSLKQIKKRGNRSISFGCRKAGLYHYRDAIPDMLAALDALSSSTQYQILMGLSRIGDIEAMRDAFKKISKFVIVNERAIYDILSAFTGNKLELFRLMLAFEDEYVAAIFLKAIEPDVAISLKWDIVTFLMNGTKELRVAAAKAFCKMGKDAPAEYLIRALSDDDWEVRAISAKALGELECPAAGDALVTAMSDCEWWVRQNSAAALLSHPDCTKLFLRAAQKRDVYSLDSMMHVLENTEKQYLLSKLMTISVQLNIESNLIPFPINDNRNSAQIYICGKKDL